MSLVENTLFGTIDKVAVAIERIREFEPEEGYYVAFSGGKDSQVVLDLVERAGVKYDAHFNVTTVDPPELMRFMREHYPNVVRERPDTSMYKLIIKKRLPPTRMARYCCEYLKERGGEGRIVVTGIRWEESSGRKQRRLMETCYRRKRITYLHPIIDWTLDDVWAYLNGRGLPHCELYDQGMRRIGCVMCPMQSLKDMRADAERWPKFAAMYRRACRKSYEEFHSKKELRPGDADQWKSGDEIYRWWLTKYVKRGWEPELFERDEELPEMFPMTDN